MSQSSGLNMDFNAGVKLAVVAVAVGVMIYVVVRVMESINRRRGGSD